MENKLETLFKLEEKEIEMKRYKMIKFRTISLTVEGVTEDKTMSIKIDIKIKSRYEKNIFSLPKTDLLKDIKIR